MAKYKIAELIIETYPRFEFTKKYLSDYETDDNGKTDILIEVTDEMLKYEKELALEETSALFYEPIAILRVICENMYKHDGFFLHCSSLKYKDGAYVFLGKSGTGKSTHARLWREHFKDEVVMINDDKPIVRYKDGEFIIYGTPYRGKHALGDNISAPIKAIYLLEQHPENIIEEMKPVDSITALLHQTVIPSDRDAMKKLLDLFGTLISATPIFRLKCTISDEAVQKALSVL